MRAARAIVTTPCSIGWRSTSSARRENSGISSRNSTPWCARLISPGRGMRAAADQRRFRHRVVRRAKRPHGRQAAPAGSSPATECTVVTSSDSSKVSGGSSPGRRLASIVLPAPGGPTSSRLWPPAAATSSARRPSACPCTSARSGSSRASRRRGGGRTTARGSDGVIQHVHRFLQRVDRQHAQAFDDRRLPRHSPRAAAADGSPCVARWLQSAARHASAASIRRATARRPAAHR